MQRLKVGGSWTFDPNRLGSYEKAGWEAYYDRNWLRAFWLLMRLSREQFRMSWLTACGAAIDTVRASIAFAPQDNDLPQTQAALTQFYRKAERSVGLHAEAAHVAVLELEYWVVHRQLAMRRQRDPADINIAPMIDALARLHAAIFGTTAERMHVSAQLRALAAVAVDRITSKQSTDVPADWSKVEDLLQQAYKAVQLAQRATEK